MKAEIKGDNLIITIPFDKAGQRSATGKTMVHASSKGNIDTGVVHNGEKLIVGLNAYTKNAKS
jgi:hypothetical protein